MDYSLVRESIRLRVQTNNEKAKAALIKQLRSPLGVIPFLGAGVSAPFKYRQWGEFLGGAAREQLGGSQKAAVEEAVAKERLLPCRGSPFRRPRRAGFPAVDLRRVQRRPTSLR